MSSDACGGTQRCKHRIQILTRRISQLEAELWAAWQQSAAQCQRLADKYEREFLVLNNDPNTRATSRI